MPKYGSIPRSSSKKKKEPAKTTGIKQPAQHQADEAKMKRGLTAAQDMVRQHWKGAIRFDSSSEQRKKEPAKTTGRPHNTPTR
jgi:hypothetical protein